MRRTACAAIESSKLMQEKHREIPSYSRVCLWIKDLVCLKLRRRFFFCSLGLYCYSLWFIALVLI
ncbi:unnamed protein product [Prunus brigantina]